jgi:hypothetical protein
VPGAPGVVGSATVGGAVWPVEAIEANPGTPLAPELPGAGKLVPSCGIDARARSPGDWFAQGGAVSGVAGFGLLLIAK